MEDFKIPKYKTGQKVKIKPLSEAWNAPFGLTEEMDEIADAHNRILTVFSCVRDNYRHEDIWRMRFKEDGGGFNWSEPMLDLNWRFRTKLDHEGFQFISLRCGKACKGCSIESCAIVKKIEAKL
jgi:hypothetical protein